MNVIVIMADTYRRDMMGCYGGDWVRTPCLDAFAKKSMVFDRAYIGSFPTIPNRTDLFTGKFVFPFYGWQPLAEDEVVLAQVLTEAGYVTQLIHDTAHLRSRKHNFDRGFKGWYFVRGAEADGLMTTANSDIELPCPPEKCRGNGRACLQYLKNTQFWRKETDWHVAETMLHAEEWLEQNYRADNFFLWIDTFETHEPWMPPQWYTDMYDPGYTGEVNYHPDYNFTDFLKPEELSHCRALFAGEMTLVDKWVGYLLRKVEDLRLDQNTAIIFTADHGFYLGEHDRIGKHTLRTDPWPLYEEVARIPLMIYLPGMTKGKRCGAITQPADIMPTILDLCRTKDPGTMHGESLVPILKGKQRSLYTHALSSGSLADKMAILQTPVTVTNATWQAILRPAGQDCELYNLRTDPQVKKNVAKRNPKVIAGLRKEIVKFLKRVNAPEDTIAAYEPK